MKHFLISSLFIFTSLALFSSDSTVVIKTDSSVIKKFYSEFGNWTEEYFNEKSLVHIVSNFPDNNIIEHDYYYNKTPKNRVGIGEIYNEDGTLKLTLDYNKGTWFPGDSLKYPHHSLLNKMKLHADSLLQGIYCKEFLNKHLKWNIFNSYYFDKTYTEPSFSINWIRDESYNYQPTEFYVSYDLFESGIRHEKAINILFDVSGNLLQSHKWNNNWTINNKGLEYKNEDSCKCLNLKLDLALKMASQYGLKKTNSTNTRTEFTWVNSDSISEIYNGKWRIHVLKNIKQKRKKTNKGVTYTDYYDTWVFNPWTGGFIERKITERKYSISSIF